MGYIVISAGSEKTLHIGKQGENKVTRIDFSAFFEECKTLFGAGTLALAHERQEDSGPYLVALTDGLYWDVSSSDVAKPGTGWAELSYTVGNQVKKSLRWKTCTLSALGQTVTPPAAWQSYIDQVTAQVASVTGMTVSAVAASEASVTKGTDAQGNVHLTFGLQRGNPGVYIGSGDMPDDCNVQIDPQGSAVDIHDDIDRIDANIGEYPYMMVDAVYTSVINKGVKGEQVGGTLQQTTSANWTHVYIDASAYDVFDVTTYKSAQKAYKYYGWALNSNGVILQTYGETEGEAKVNANFTATMPAGTAQFVALTCYGVSNLHVKKKALRIINDALTALERRSSGTRWLAMGDSITQGWYSYYADDDAHTPSSKSPTSSGDTFSDMWVAVAARIKGITVDNYGVGGSGWRDKGSNDSPKPNARQQVDGSVARYPAPDFTRYDLVTLAWGVNDWKGSQTFGSWDDDLTVDNVIPNMRYVIETIIEKNPSCKIIGISPLNNMVNGSTYAENYAIGHSINGKTLEQAWAAMKQVYDYYNIETIDMLHSSYLNRNNIGSLLIDKIHPSKVGHELMGRELADKIHFA